MRLGTLCYSAASGSDFAHSIASLSRAVSLTLFFETGMC